MVLPSSYDDAKVLPRGFDDTKQEQDLGILASDEWFDFSMFGFIQDFVFCYDLLVL